jgi:hypothetical protein
MKLCPTDGFTYTKCVWKKVKESVRQTYNEGWQIKTLDFKTRDDVHI